MPTSSNFLFSAELILRYTSVLPWEDLSEAAPEQPFICVGSITALSVCHKFWGSAILLSSDSSFSPSLWRFFSFIQDRWHLLAFHSGFCHFMSSLMITLLVTVNANCPLFFQFPFDSVLLLPICPVFDHLLLFFLHWFLRLESGTDAKMWSHCVLLQWHFTSADTGLFALKKQNDLRESS